MRIGLATLLVLSLPLALWGCAPVISKNLRDAADPSLTFTQVLKTPDAYNGKTVIWGGEIIETVNQKDGGTMIEIFQRPLGWRGEPTLTVASEGRFLVLVDSYLDPYRFRQGKRITVGGEILGHEAKPLGQMDYVYPLVLAKQVYLWDEYYYAYPPYYYDPWWGYPYGWGFAWGYPYGWRFRFYYPR